MTKWVTKWKYEMSPKPVATGIYRLKTGGFFLRARVANRLGEMKPLYEVVHGLRTIAEAKKRRDALIAEARAEVKGEARTRQLWSDFAVSLLEESVARGDIESQATIEWWQGNLEQYLLPAFGSLRATDVTRARIDAWLTETVLPWMKKGRLIQRIRKKTGLPFGQSRLVKLKPVTVNGVLRVLRTISNAIKVKFDLNKSAFDGIEFLPEGRTYTREEPNSLASADVHRFLQIARTMYAQHYFMILLGFVTGLRPSSMRALRRQGPRSDIDWTTGEIQIRRSHARGHAVMDKTKTKVDNTFTLPPALLEEARRHVAALPEGAPQASDLLFPTRAGKLRSRTVLTKPFAAIVAELGLGMRVTPRAMRRSFNDLAREAGLAAVVTRSISGHLTDEMQLHYSTARSQEQAAALDKVHAAVRGEGETT